MIDWCVIGWLFCGILATPIMVKEERKLFILPADDRDWLFWGTLCIVAGPIALALAILYCLLEELL